MAPHLRNVRWDVNGGHVVANWGADTTTSQKVTVEVPSAVTGFFNLPNPSSRIMTLNFTNSLMEMSTRNLPGGKERPARKGDNLTTICEPKIHKMSKPRHSTGLYASLAFHKAALLFTSCLVIRVPAYRYRGPGIDSWREENFGELVGLERSPFSLVRIVVEILGRKTRGSGLKKLL
jgi:hypothetical protein